jgi:ABC-type Fe3+/spermidine/putrescine transport system ATPase subunit
MTQVTLKDLSKTYPGSTKPALDRLSLDIASGELTAFLGPSGCGKTTSMKMIAGLLQPSSGDVLFDGRSVLADTPEQRSAVMVFQNHLLFPHMTVAENVGFGLRMRHMARPKIAARVADLLALVQLPDLGARRPSELSGGQQQRVALARALILRPKVLLLDEPLSNLDAHLRDEMRNLIRTLQRQLAITTILVTHDQEEAVVLADRIALILDGQLRQFAPADIFYKRPADAAVARFFGGRNFVPGTSVEGMFQSALGPLHLPADARPGPGTLTFRPEAVRLGQSGENCLTARVLERTFLGTQTRLRLTAAGVPFEAVLSPDVAEGLAIGAEVPVTLPRNTLWVMA